MSKFRREIGVIIIWNSNNEIPIAYKNKHNRLKHDTAYFSKENFFKELRTFFNLYQVKECQICVGVLCKCNGLFEESYELFHKKERDDNNGEEVLRYIIKEFTDNDLKIVIEDDCIAFVQPLQISEKLLISL